jgi:sortase (surface protein transpeptidase)
MDVTVMQSEASSSLFQELGVGRTTRPTRDREASELSAPEKLAAGWKKDVLLVPGAALVILAILLVSLIAQLSFMGAISHTRNQEVLYSQFRESLANATAPTGQVADGALIALGTPVALLEIPAIGVKEVVVEGTTSTQLMSGPGHSRDSVLPGQSGNAVVVGRQAGYGGPFARLGELKVNQKFSVTTGQGVQQYKVSAIRQGDQAPVGNPASRLTLVSAAGTPFVPSKALFVDADLTSPVQATPTQVLSQSSLAKAERAFGGESGAWIAVALWLQVLAIVVIAIVVAAVRWGKVQAWVVGLPLILFVTLSMSEQVTRLLPNVL